MDSKNSVSALYFDGTSSKAFEVTVSLDPTNKLILTSPAHQKSYSAAEMTLSSHIESSPAIIRLKDGATIEIPDSASCNALIDQLFSQSRIAEGKKLYKLWTYIAVGLLSLSLLVWSGLGPKLVAQIIPDYLKQSIGNQMLEILDNHLFRPTKLSSQKVSELRIFLQIAADASKFDRPVKINFRSTNSEIANALAILPDQILITDDLVSKLDQAELQAVFAHELGHLALDHGTERLVLISFVEMLKTWVLGSSSEMLSSLATSAMSASYSRSQEEEADDFAAKLLPNIGSSSAKLATALEKISDESVFPESINSVFGIFSSHPETPDRIRRLRRRQ